jgi:lambda family phage tail tape measure protein
MADNKIIVVIGAENQTGSAFGQVRDGLNGLVDKLGGLEGILGKLAIEEVVRHLVEFAHQTLESEMALVKLSEKTGIAVGELSGLAAAAKLSNVEQDVFEMSLKKLATAVSNAAAGEEKAADALKAVGVNAKDANGHVIGIGDALNKVADKFAATKDGTDKAALAVQLFGREGLAMIPMLNEGSAGLARMSAEAQRLGATLSDADGRALKQLENDLDTASLAAKGMMMQFLAGMIPSLDQMAKAATDSSGGLDLLRKSGEGVGAIFRFLEAVLLSIAATASLGAREILALFGIVQHSTETLDEKLTVIWKDLFGTFKLESQKAADQSKADLERINKDWKAIAKEKLAAEIDGYKQAASIARATNAAELANLEESYRQRLVSVDEYFEKKRALELNSLQVAKTNAQLEADALLKAAEHAPDEKERLSTLRQEAQVTAQISELTSQIFAAQGKNPATGEVDELVQMARSAEIFAEKAKRVGEDIDAVFADLDEEVQRVNTAVDNYQLTAIQGEQRVNQLRDQARKKIAGMADEYARLALESGDVKLVANADKFEKKVDELGIHLNSVRKEAIQGATQDLETFFTGILDGSQRGANAFIQFGKSLISTLAAIEAKMLAVWLIQKALGWLGKLGGGAASASGGFGEGADSASFMAGGGSASAGQWSWVGEQGPELVRFGEAATVIPHGASMELAAGGGDVHYHIDARGAQAGVSQEILNALRVTEERSVARAKIEMRELQRRRV